MTVAPRHRTRAATDSGAGERIVNVYEAKTHLSRLLEQVADGEEIVLARSGKPVARLVPYQRTTAPRRLGLLAGRLTVTASFDDDDAMADPFDRMLVAQAVSNGWTLVTGDRVVARYAIAVLTA